MSEGASGGNRTLTEEEAVRLYRASIETFNHHGIEAWLATCTDDLR